MICKKLQVSVGFVAASDFTVRGFWCVLYYDCCASLLTPGGVLLCFPHVFSPGKGKGRRREEGRARLFLWAWHGSCYTSTEILKWFWSFYLRGEFFSPLLTLQAKISRLPRVQSSLLPCRLPSLSSHLSRIPSSSRLISRAEPGRKVEVRCSVCPTALWIRETCSWINNLHCRNALHVTWKDWDAL